jgi:hypothetical protein
MRVRWAAMTIEYDDELARVRAQLAQGGLPSMLRGLNARTPFRFTGVYRFDGDLLRNVSLFDRWAPEAEQGADAPMSETFCALVREGGDALQVADGRTDMRFPWMAQNAVVCYCGALIRDDDGEPVGTLCHFDVQRCEPPSSEMRLLQAVTPLVYRFLAERQLLTPEPARSPPLPAAPAPGS